MSGSVLEIGKWSHIVGVHHDKTGIDLYVDGNYIGSDNTRSGLYPNASIGGETHAGVWYVANPSQWGGAWFDGDIDEIRIYNHALTAGDIAALFAEGCGVTVVDIDIKPGSCPNPLNVKSKGVLPVAIFGTADFDVNEIDPASLRLLEEVAPLRSALEDVGRPEDAEDCYYYGPDGWVDLTLKFSTQEIVGALDDVSDGDVLVLELTGNCTMVRPLKVRTR